MKKQIYIYDNLYAQKYWDRTWDKYIKFEVASKENIVRKWLEKYFKVLITGRKSVFEIGCFPGTYLTIFGELGYELNGIDLYYRVDKELRLWLESKNYRIGKFYCSNFFNYNENKKFDIVCSFGFLEHFKNWEEVLIRHASFVKTEGYLVISTPNFQGFIQRILHIFLDREQYERHYTPSMNPLLWKNIAEKLGFDVISYGSFGNFWFWAYSENMNIIQRTLTKLIRKVSLIFHLNKLPNSKIYSPFYGLIARKI